MTVKYVQGYKKINDNVRADREIKVFDDKGKSGSVPAAAQPYVVEEVLSNGTISKVKLTCTNLPVSISDDADVAQYGGVQIYDLPEGIICSMGCVVGGTMTLPAPFIDAWEGDVAIGTVTASTGATLTSTEANIMQSVAIAAASTKVGTVDAAQVATALTESGARWIDGSSTPIDMYLNFVVDDNAAHTPRLDCLPEQLNLSTWY